LLHRPEDEPARNEIKLTLRKPVGIVFAQKPDGGPGKRAVFDVWLAVK
jgi:hypothetical protein